MKFKRKQWNKNAFLARDWIISLIIFAGIVSLAVIMVASNATEYGNTGIIDESIKENFGNLQNSTSIATSAFDAANEKGGLSVASSFGLLFNSAFTVISLVFGSIGIAGAQLFALSEYLGVPTEVAQVLFPMFISILTVILVFLIISSTTRRDI